MPKKRSPRLASSRRDFLAAFLGVPLAISGCGQRPPTNLAGSIVGPAVHLGHRLRQAPPTQPTLPWRDTQIVIVGGGVTGLSAAWRLRRSGCTDFVLLELEATPGGTSRSDEHPLVPYPWGAHYLPAPFKDNTALLKLLSEADILEGFDAAGEPKFGEEHIYRAPQERLFYRGRWYEDLYPHFGATADDLAQWERYKQERDSWVAWRDSQGRRAFAVPVARSSDDADVTALAKLSFADWLAAKNFTSPRLLWWLEYGCRDDYGSTLQQTSAWAGLFYSCARLPKPGQDTQPYLTWPEGNGRLVAHLYRQVHEQVQLGQLVCQLLPQETGVEVLAVSQEPNGTEHVHGYRAKQVIFAAPSFLARSLVQPYRADPPRHLADFEYGSWLVANLFLRARPANRGFPLCWDNVLYDSPSLGYVVATHQRGLDHGPTIFTYYYPFCQQSALAERTKLLSLSWQEGVDLVLTDLSRAHPELRTLVERVDLMRWGHAMIRPRPGFLWSQSLRAARQPYRQIHFAHADLSGVALFEEAFAQGIRAAEAVLQAQGERVEP